MRPRDQDVGDELDIALQGFRSSRFKLKGIQSQANRESLVEQLVESVRRIKFLHVVRDRELSPLRADPRCEHFDPLKASVLHKRAGQLDEAFWLVFLAVHFAKNGRSGWRLTRDVYGRLGADVFWSWDRVKNGAGPFRKWLDAKYSTLKHDGVHRAFGNHRKYISLDAWKSNGTGDAVDSYVKWVAEHGGHLSLISGALDECDGDPKKAFRSLYRCMEPVVSFGRIGKFDYLTMVANLGLAPILPDCAYLQHATGPLAGARLLFAGNAGVKLHWKALEEWLIELDGTLDVGMQVLEDALCNWQKSPSKFVPFRG